MPIGEVISYRDAMKMFNQDTFSGSLWGIPKKGYAGYNAVQHIRKGEPHKTFTTIAELKKQEDPISVPTKKQQEKAKAVAKAEEDKKKKAEEDKIKAEAEAKKVKRKLKKLEKEKKQLEEVVTQMQQIVVEEAPQIALEVSEIVQSVNLPVIELSSTIPDGNFFGQKMEGVVPKNIISGSNIKMPPASLNPPPSPSESGLNKVVVVNNIEEMSSTSAPVQAPVSVSKPVFAPDSTWKPDDEDFYSYLLAGVLNGNRNDYRKRGMKLSMYDEHLKNIKTFQTNISDLNTEASALSIKQTKIFQENNRKVNEEYAKLTEEIREKEKQVSKITKKMVIEQAKKQYMEQWKPQNKIVYGFHYDGYNPQKIIDKLPKTGTVQQKHIIKQLEWIINERSNTMKEINKTRGNPIRTVEIDFILNDTDGIFVKFAWEIRGKEVKENRMGGYVSTYHSHFLEEYKISLTSDIPTKFQSEETVMGMRTKEEKEAEDKRLKEEAQANNGVHKVMINGHSVTYRGKDIKSGKYDDLYITDKPKQINDTSIVEEKKVEYGHTTVWKDERLKGRFSYDGGVIIKINRIDIVAKKFYWNIIGYAFDNGFVPYEDTKERESKTTTKGGEVNIPFEKLSARYEVPALEVKKAEMIKSEDGSDGKHHFQKYGFNATASNDKKASMKNAVYDDLVYFSVYKHLLDKDEDYRAKILGFTKEDYEVYSKPVMRTEMDWKTGKNMKDPKTGEDKLFLYEESFKFVAKWTDKSKGLASVVGYYDYSSSSFHKVMLTEKQYIVQFPYKKANKKYDDFDKMKVEDYDLSELSGKV